MWLRKVPGLVSGAANELDGRGPAKFANKLRSVRWTTGRSRFGPPGGWPVVSACNLQRGHLRVAWVCGYTGAGRPIRRRAVPIATYGKLQSELDSNAGAVILRLVPSVALATHSPTQIETPRGDAHPLPASPGGDATHVQRSFRTREREGPIYHRRSSKGLSFRPRTPGCQVRSIPSLPPAPGQVAGSAKRPRSTRLR